MACQLHRNRLRRDVAGSNSEAIFQLFSLGVVSSRDEWVYDLDKIRLAEKISHFCEVFNEGKLIKSSVRTNDAASEIKWSRALKALKLSGHRLETYNSRIATAAYRPFGVEFLYFDTHLNEVQYQLKKIFGKAGDLENVCIVFTDAGSQKPFMVAAVDRLFDYHFVGAAAAGTGTPRYRYPVLFMMSMAFWDFGASQR